MSPKDSTAEDNDVFINPIHPSVEDKLDEKVKAIYMTYQAHRLRADQVTFEEFDANRDRYIFPRDKVASPFCPVGRITTHRVPVADPCGEIDVRIYHPSEDRLSSSRKGTGDRDLILPLYVNFHGGGFVLGGLEDDDPLCRQLCQTTPCLVANVAYRLAPQFPHPVPVTDSWAALQWLVAHAQELGIDAHRIAVGGLSAGGCLAAALAQMARKEERHCSGGSSSGSSNSSSSSTLIPEMPPLVLQLLIVPVLDARYVPLSAPETDRDVANLDTPYPSYRSCAFAPMLPLQRLVWFYRPWLGADPDTHANNANDVRASPLAAPDADLVGLPPASIHAAEIDPLRSEAEAYHARLTKAGTSSKLKVYGGMVHPFAQWDGQLAQGRELIRDLAAALREAFGIADEKAG